MVTQWLREHIWGGPQPAWRLVGLALVLTVWGRLIINIAYSFSWPMDGDLAFLYYIAWLMNEHDYVPYRDIHETSFLGTFIFYSYLTQVTGYSVRALHGADLVIFLLLGLATLRLLRAYGALSGLLAIGIFGEFYFKMGVGVHLQRDYIALLPAALAVVVLQEDKLSSAQKALLSGILFGTASCIKPQFIGGAALVGAYLAYETRNRGFRTQAISIVSVFLGTAIVWALAIYWLYARGVVGAFFDMALNYLPAYSSINGRNFARDSVDAWTGAAKWSWGMVSLWAPMVGASVFALVLWRKETRSRIALLIIFWLLYLSYVPMAGKYWGYHILPSYYFLALLLSLVVSGWPRENHWIAMMLVVVVWGSGYFFNVKDRRINGSHEQARQSAMEAEILVPQLSSFLQQNLGPGETVLPHVSHTRGSVFPSLLQARALPATPYLENYLLYHDIGSTFVKTARDRFMAKLKESPPRYIVYTPTLFGFRGPDTETTFAPFEQWMAANYQRVYIPQTPSSAAFQRIEVYEYLPGGQRLNSK